MRRILLYVALLPLFLFCRLEAGAHVPPQEHAVHTIGDTEGVDSLELYKRLYRNAPDEFRSDGVPNVAFIGKNSKFIVGFGGYAKAVIGWDIGHPIESADEFITSQIPMHPMEGDRVRFNLSAQQSHLFVNFVALPGSQNEIGAFVSANFLNNYMPVLQFAYLKYRGFEAGYDYSLFSDPACGAPAVDYEGPCSSTANPVAGIRYLWPLGKQQKWLLGVGLELPQTSFTVIPGHTKQVTQAVPDIPVALRYEWNEGGSWTRVSAMFRNLMYRDLPQAKNHDKFGYGFQLSGGWYFLDKFIFFYQGVWGKGIASMVQDTVDEGLDMTPGLAPDTLDPVMLWGFCGALQYDINDRFCCSTTYSQLRTYADNFNSEDPEWGELYRYAQYSCTNVFCHVTSHFDVGLEYIWGRRTNYDGLKCADNRIQAMFQLSF